jgi:phage-related protein
MAGSASVHIPFTASDGISPKISRINKSMAGLSKSTIKSGTAIGTALGTFVGGLAIRAFDGVVQGIGDTINASRDLQETIAKTGQVFGDQAPEIEAFAATAATAFGQSKTQAMDAAAGFAVFGKSAGLTGDGLVGFSTELTTLASDLASFSNTSVEEAITSISAGLRGESLPLRKYGVLLDEATLRARALAMGLIKTTKTALTPQQKVLAAQGEIMAQTSLQQGDFARTSTGLANTQRTLTARMEDLKAGIGDALLPVALALTNAFINHVLPAIEKLKPAIETLIATAKGLYEGFKRDVMPTLLEVARNVGPVLAAAFATLGDILRNNVMPAVKGVFGFLADNKEAVLAITAGIVAMVAAFKTYQMVMTAVQVVMKAYAIIQGIVNIVMSANPVGLIVLAIVGLIAAFAALYASSEGFRDAVGGLFSALGAAFDFVIGLIRTIIGFFWNGPMGIIIKAIAGLAGIDLSGVDKFINGGAAPGAGTGGTGTSTNPMNDKYGGPTTVNVQIGNEQLVPTVTRVMGSTANAGTGRRGY